MKKLDWALILLMQAISAFVWSCLVTLLMVVEPACLYKAASWALLPLLGGASAYFACVKGLNNYVAWILPCVCGVAAHYAVFFVLPKSPGPTFLCAVVSVIGAATGDTHKKFLRGKGGVGNGK